MIFLNFLQQFTSSCVLLLPHCYILSLPRILFHLILRKLLMYGIFDGLVPCFPGSMFGCTKIQNGMQILDRVADE